ncbi:hypothetical protein NDU88_002000 [Pleurodeles waltl]|uniref:Uncharacterized protein n=1 Tax=Pleurodeles waltl TaxID=8319 RepID=A0AAV7KUB6_PLEWA|nr:hypothetical protein NDU88_002000 [Pleurodeles waltl]
MRPRAAQLGCSRAGAQCAQLTSSGMAPGAAAPTPGHPGGVDQEEPRQGSRGTRQILRSHRPAHGALRDVASPDDQNVINISPPVQDMFRDVCRAVGPQVDFLKLAMYRLAYDGENLAPMATP